MKVALRGIPSFLADSDYQPVIHARSATGEDGVYLSARPPWQSTSMRAMIFLIAAVLLGLSGGYAWSKWSKPSAADVANAPKGPSAKPGQSSDEIEESAYYANCDAVRAAGKAPLYAGQPGYRAELDPDGTGLACPPQS